MVTIIYLDGRLIRLLIVSDYPVVRAGLQALLGEQDGIAVVGQVALGEAMLVAVADLRPDAVAIDLRGERSDFGVLGQLASAVPGMGIVIVSGDAHADFVSGAMAAGARGFLLREAGGEELAAAIGAVHQGLFVLHPAVAPGVLRPPGAPAGVRGSEGEALTPRELEVVVLLARGLPNKTIASTLNLSEHTVKFHVASIMGKLAASSRTEAVANAVRRGLIAL